MWYHLDKHSKVCLLVRPLHSFLCWPIWLLCTMVQSFRPRVFLGSCSRISTTNRNRTLRGWLATRFEGCSSRILVVQLKWVSRYRFRHQLALGRWLPGRLYFLRHRWRYHQCEQNRCCLCRLLFRLRHLCFQPIHWSRGILSPSMRSRTFQRGSDGS